MKSKRLARVLGVAAIMGAATLLGNGAMDGFTANQAAVSAASYDRLTTSDGKWEFTAEGKITAYKGTETEVTIPNKVTANGVDYEIKAFSSWTFMDSNVEKINIPAFITKIENKSFSRCPELKEIHVSSDNANYCSVDGILYNKAKTLILGVPQKLNRTHVVLPETVEKAEYGSFNGNETIAYIKFPAAFKLECSNLDLFQYLAGAEYIDVDENNQDFKSVDGILYYKDMKELISYPPCRAAQSYEVPESVTKLGDYSIKNAKNLKNVSFSKTFVEIGSQVFKGCSLTSINNVTTREEYIALDSQTKKNIQDNLTSLEKQPIITSLTEQEIDYAVDTYITQKHLVSDYDKVFALYQYVANKVSYYSQEDVNFNNNCITSVFLRDEVVCEGYAYGMRMLLNRIGLRNEMAFCDRKGEDVGHAWNLVSINGKWVHLDITFDDGKTEEDPGPHKTWFLKSDDEYNELGHRTDYYILSNPSTFVNYPWVVTDPNLNRGQVDSNPLFGDLNSDGKLTDSDLRAMTNEIRGFANYASRGYYNITADMNRDGAIDSEDYNILNDLVNPQTAL